MQLACYVTEMEGSLRWVYRPNRGSTAPAKPLPPPPLRFRDTGVSVWVYNASSTACREPCAYVQCLEKAPNRQDTHINTQIEGYTSYSCIFSVAVLSLICSVCSCVRLRCFATRLHCQSACLIGCTPVRTTTLSSSPWRPNLSSAEEKTLSEPLNTTEKKTQHWFLSMSLM